MNYSLRPYQQKAVDFALERLAKSDKPLLMSLGTGCHAKGTAILMADGTTKAVEDIQVGDMLMGQDRPKKVLALHRGEQQMYRIVPVKGKPFIVNAEHILHIQQYENKTVDGKKKYQKYETNICVSNLLKSTQTYQRNAKLVYGAYNYGTKPKMTLSPWVIGTYLGDGLVFSQSDRETVFYNQDTPVIQKMQKEIEKMGWAVKQSQKDYLRHSIVCGQTPSPFKKIFFDIGAMDRKSFRKSFPRQALSWDKQSRLELLAGLLDTDGSYDGKDFDFLSQYPDITHGVVLLARSLGIGATENTKSVKLKGWVEAKTYYRACLSGGNILDIPCVKHHIKPNLQHKKQTVTGFTVEPLGLGEYYGFEVDGDHLYLDGEMIVHHNSGKTWMIAEIAKQWQGKVLVLTLSKELCEQDYEKMKIVVGDGVGMYSASWNRKEVESITIATIQSAYKHPELWEEYTLIIGDEVDNLPVDGMFGELVQGKKVLGLTATPYATVGSRKGSWFTTKLWPMHKIKTKNYGWFWQPVEFCVSEKELLGQGFLCPTKIYASPVACNILKIASNGSEYTTESIERWAEQVYSRIIQVMEGAESHNMCKSGIVFMPSVESCEVLEEMCEKVGLSAKAVHYKTDAKIRDQIIADHKNGKLRWLINQGVATRGFDNPMVDCLVIARPTRSLRLHRQILGRGIRIADGKKICNVIDLTENTKTWGGPEDVEMGKKSWEDTILLRGKDISGAEVAKINLQNVRRKSAPAPIEDYNDIRR